MLLPLLPKRLAGVAATAEHAAGSKLMPLNTEPAKLRF